MSATLPLCPPSSVGPDVVRVKELLHRVVVGYGSPRLGSTVDVVARLRPGDYPQVTGLVVHHHPSGRRASVPLEQVGALHDVMLVVSASSLDLSPFRRRSGELLWHADVLGHRLIDLRIVRLVRAADVELYRSNRHWFVARVDIAGGWWRRLLSRSSRIAMRQDRKAFERLVGPERRDLVRAFTGLSRLKVSQIADLVEAANKAEKAEILGYLRTVPELEAEVFEELDEEPAGRLLAQRSDAEIATLLEHMRADDAAGAAAQLDYDRLESVLALMAPHQRFKLRTLLGFNPDTAGGVMGVHLLTVASTATVADATAAVARATEMQPEALTDVYIVDDDGRLHGVVSLVRLVQAHPDQLAVVLAEPDPVRVGPDADLVDVAVLMSDNNLLTLPLVDKDRRPIGLITVDESLVTTIPIDWRRRGPSPALHGLSDCPPPGGSPK